jgi:hypothetical protein
MTFAIKLGERLLADQPDHPDKLWIHALLAAAYGQKFRYLKAQKANEDALKETRDIALSRAREAAKDSRWKLVLQQLCEPLRFGGMPDDNDLDAFAVDPDFKHYLDFDPLRNSVLVSLCNFQSSY